jgi:DNA-binding NtrC family response regulator
MRWAIRTILAETGLEVAEASAGEGGLELAARCEPDAVLLDIQMPGIDGEEVLRRLRHHQKDLPVIMVTAYGTIPGAVEAIRSGAFEYITKPFRNEILLDVVHRAVSRRRSGGSASTAQVRSAITSVMGHGAAVQLLVDQIETVIATNYSVLIRGETGAGKEVVARCLHEKGPRADHPLVVVDCGSVVDTLIDSEFFGHEKGAYTGAANRRLGWFETAARGGTLFLDEIGNLSPTGQKALLRALEERVIHRVGSTTPIKIDVRVIAATNEALEERIDRAGFREDLFFRLAEYVIVLPPLRARREDIGFLAGRFLDQARDSLARPRIDIAPDGDRRHCA